MFGFLKKAFGSGEGDAAQSGTPAAGTPSAGPAPAPAPKSAPAEDEINPGDFEVDCRTVKALLDQKVITLVDVREKYEWDAGHIEGAVFMPLSQLQDRIGELTADTNIVVYCQHGMRSMDATMYFHESGYGLVKSMAGGYAEWCSAIE